MDKDIDYYLGVFEKMKRALMRGVKAPHKPLLLLAILNLCQRGTIKDNHIVLSSVKSLRDVFAYAEIDQELYDLMVNRESAVILECKLRELV
ncbi:hypothetical protein ACTQ1W_00595 [Segatella copri]|uniref:hypothetical protein n=1 Tax=Segatella copri TaxID=165179 RepID=UPI00261DF82F|nr:hypothetical protein [Segatella copri]